MGANIFTNRPTDRGEGRGLVIFGNRGLWRKRMSFSQEAGPFVVAGFIGFISTARDCCIDRETAAPPWASFLFDIRDRG